MKINYPGDRGKLWFSSIVTVALAMILADAGALRSQPLQIAPGFPEPLGVSGVSGGRTIAATVVLCPKDRTTSSK